MGIIDLSYSNLCLGFLLLLIPVGVLYFFKTGLSKDILVSSARMAIQLFLVGIYLKYLFLWNNCFVNILWMLIIIMITSYTIIKRCKLEWKQLFLPLTISLLISLVLIDSYFLGVVIKLDYILESRYFIPITGMLLGNMLSTNVISINTYVTTLRRERLHYQYLLGNGATKWEAVSPFIKQALITAYNPTIASMAVMGLISLPGTMTGQILGGSSPDVAIKYQIMMMVSIFSATLVSVMISLGFITNWLIDKQGNSQLFESKDK